ncbi:hypothetical protein [Leeuwenhoekiella sp. H156]|uniref:hypothetical protein n=1 Tax=Leeuwenhoekiella sp. H156 TaxID=3450128 RepID=UPI003FA46D8E
MKVDYFKILITILLLIVIYNQLSQKEVDRYKYDSDDLIVFDSKTGTFYSPEIGVYNVVKEGIEKEKSKIDK